MFRDPAASTEQVFSVTQPVTVALITGIISLCPKQRVQRILRPIFRRYRRRIEQIISGLEVVTIIGASLLHDFLRIILGTLFCYSRIKISAHSTTMQIHGTRRALIDTLQRQRQRFKGHPASITLQYRHSTDFSKKDCRPAAPKVRLSSELS